MTKRFLVFLLVISNGSFLLAQPKSLEIKGITSKLYIEHIIVPKENFYSISRMYNVPPKDIALYNNLQFENGLSVGQAIRIPLNDNNFFQGEVIDQAGILAPVYHSVEPKEGLYRISLNYNKVPLAFLKKWNHLQSDEVSIGTPLIVGYLKADKEQSTLAGITVKTDTRVAIAEKDEKKPEPVTPNGNPESIPVVKNSDAEEKIKTIKPETEKPKTTVTSVKTKSSIDFSGGYFKKLYNDQVEKRTPLNETARAGVFKSTSGWQDGKYYCFNNEAVPGTIIKITDNTSGKSVFAKVLDAIPEIKQNEGLGVIVSNSAAEELGIGEIKFDCNFSFVK
ncbi:MAG: LysM peptidoglycan-binding domain-containing protein [Ginsengibacter sp.]